MGEPARPAKIMDAQAAVDPTAVQRQLERILASPDFLVAERARRFLRFVVEETLAGRGDRIKAYSIATSVFERDATFDAQNDPVVRIEAGRLRRALERYYLVAGGDDPVTITIPKGAYVPIFSVASPGGSGVEPVVSATPPSLPSRRGRISLSWRTAALASLAMAATIGAFLLGDLLGRPTSPPQVAVALPSVEAPTVSVTKLLVIPFSHGEETGPAKAYAFGVTEETIAYLAKFKELVVLGRETGMAVLAHRDLERARRDTGAKYALEGSVRASGNHIRVTARLLDLTDSSILWSEAYDGDLSVNDLISVQIDIAKRVTSALAQPQGAIFNAEALRVVKSAPHQLETYGCALTYFTYRIETKPKDHAEVRACLEQAVVQFPGYSTGWALLSFMYIDEDRYWFNPKADKAPALERALAAARRAIELDPRNPRALHAMMLALFLNGETEASLAVGREALNLNPNDAELLSDYGQRLALSGQWPAGEREVRRALDWNPGNGRYYRAVLALIAYMERDYPRALDLIEKADIQANPYFHLVAAAIYAQSGMTSKARAAAESGRTLRPQLIERLDVEMDRRNMRRVDQLHFADGLRKAGLKLPPSLDGDGNAISKSQ